VGMNRVSAEAVHYQRLSLLLLYGLCEWFFPGNLCSDYHRVQKELPTTGVSLEGVIHHEDHTKKRQYWTVSYIIIVLSSFVKSHDTHNSWVSLSSI